MRSVKIKPSLGYKELYRFLSIGSTDLVNGVYKEPRFPDMTEFFQQLSSVGTVWSTVNIIIDYTLFFNQNG